MTEEVELVLARDDVVLVASFLDVDVRDEQCLFRLARLREANAVRVDDLTPAAELRPALLADTVCREQENPVLGGACDGDQLRLDPRRHGEVRRVHDDVGALQRERSRHLREAEVVTDLHADAPERRVPYSELVAGRHEPVDSEERQV